jgi:hypothetical protein
MFKFLPLAANIFAKACILSIGLQISCGAAIEG